MSASSRKEFENWQGMHNNISSLDDDQDTLMTDTSSSSSSSEIAAPEMTSQQVTRYEKLRPIPSLSNDLLGVNRQLFFSLPAEVLVLQSSFFNVRDQSELSRLCIAGQAMFQAPVTEALAKLVAQHFLDGNLEKARALLKGQPNKIYYCTVEATHRRPHLALMSENKNNRNPAKIYIETKSSQLNYQFIGLNGKTLINGAIVWAELPADFPQNDQKIIAEKDKYFPIILEHISLAGHTLNRGQKVRGTLLQIAAIAGATKANANDDDMVEEWSAHLPQAEVTRQLQAVLLGEEERATRMQPYVTALEVFLSEIIAAHATAYEELKIELETCIEKFKRAFTPDPNVVITSGFILDTQLFSRAIELFRANVNGLGGRWSEKSDFFDIYGYSTLQACASVWDLQVLKEGIKDVVEVGRRPDRSLNFTSGVPADLSGVGSSCVLNIFGRRVGDRPLGGRGGLGWLDALLHNFVRAKTTSLQCVMQRPDNHAKNRRLIL